MRFRLVNEKRVIDADTFEEFLVKYRNSSFNPNSSLEEYMKACADRAKLIGIELQTTTPDDFVVDLIKSGMVMFDGEPN